MKIKNFVNKKCEQDEQSRGEIGCKSFTSEQGSDIIFYMKANKAITIALAGLLTACAIPFGTVFAAAEDEVDVYPQDFDRTLEIEALTDYAVYGDSFAYATNSTITIISRDESGDRKRTSYTHEYLITALDYDESGKLYFKTSSEISYLYGSPVTQKDHTFQSLSSTKLDISSDVFYTLEREGGKLEYWNEGSRQPVDENFSLIKKYGDTVYAIKDGTVPYTIEGKTATELDLSYTDFSGADNIACGETAEKLKADGYQVKTANIKSGSYYTQVDADAIGKEQTFTQIRTQKAEGDKPCIVLCTTGNASVVATNDGVFITATANVKDSAYTSPKNDWPLNAEGTKRLQAYAREDTGVYASPYMSKSTRIATLESGAENHVEVIEKFELDYIKTKFYKVRYETTDKETGETKTVSGYVAANVLTQYDYKAEDMEQHPAGDNDFNYDTNVVSVVLTIVIIALVIIAVMYISLIGSKKNKNHIKKEKKEKIKRDPEPVDDDEEE